MKSKLKSNFQNTIVLKSGSKVLDFFILILSLLSFQLSCGLFIPAFAAQRLPILQLEGAKGKSFQSVLKSVESSGYTPRVIREADFLFNVSPQAYRYVLLPLNAHISENALLMLRRYIDGGGKLVLIPPESAADASTARLYEMVGLSVTGTGQVDATTPFQWTGLMLPNMEHVTTDSKILVIEPSENITILASWGANYPALVTTAKGAILNWPWGRQLSATMNTIALAKVMPIAKPESFILLQQTDNASPKVEDSSLDSKPKDIKMLAPKYTYNPLIQPGNTSIQSSETNKPVEPTIENVQLPTEVQAPATVIPVQPTEPAVSFIPVTPAAAKLPEQKTSQKMSNTPPEALKMAPITPTTPAAENAGDADNEVLNNILGTPASTPHEISAPNPPNPDDPLLKDKLDAVTQEEKVGETKPSTNRQKHFSFLDPEAAEVLAPEFDYGIYSMNLRILDNYKSRIRDALEASRQLSLEMPEEKVQALLKQGNEYKRKFEALYLSGQTQAGLDAFVQARKYVLQALALTTASPKVEGRAIWLDRSTIIDSGGPAELKKRIQKLHQAGINIVYFETLNAGFPVYPSALLKNNPMVRNWDPLKTAVEEGHRLGMEVHAWVWAFAVGNRRHNPLIGQPEEYPGPVLADGGLQSEALRNRDGGLKVDDKQHEYWLSPASPKGREFLLNIYKEIVTHYDVDGLQLDYIRYPFQTSQTRMGYEPVGREQFYRSTGISLDNLDDYNARLWIAWKTYQVSSFVQQVSQTLKSIKPNLKLSAAVFPMRRESRIVAIQQDWETWINNGWIDTLSPMSYTSDPERLQSMFEYVQHSSHKHSLIYPGIALHRLDGGQLVLQLDAIRQKGSLGSTLFAGAHLDAEKVETLANGPYKETTSIPPHRDVVKSLLTLLEDYRQKFETLRRKGNLTGLSSEQTQAISEAINQLNSALSTIGSVTRLSEIPTLKIQQLQQQLSTLQRLNQSWQDADKAQHPFRAEYFEKDILLLNELLSYLADQASGSTFVFSAPDKPPVSATPVANKSGTLPASAKAAVHDSPSSIEQLELPN